MRICRGCCGRLGQRWRKNKKAARGRIKGVRPTQSREGVKGGLRPFSSAPCRVKGQRPLWGLGQRPNCFSGDQFQGNRQQRRRQRSVPASNFARPQTRSPSRSTNLLHIVAPNGRDRVAGLSDIAALFRNAGISLLRERGGGFALAPSTPSQCTLLLLNFYWSRENRHCCGDKGAFRSPP